MLILISFLAASLAAVFFADRIASYIINRFSPCSFSCEKWGSPLNRSLIEDGRVGFKKEPIIISFDRAVIGLKEISIFGKKRAILSGELNGVKIKGVPLTGTDVKKPSELFQLPLSESIVYDSVKFVFTADDSGYSVSDFRAISKDVRVLCDYRYSSADGKVSIKLNLSFSPGIGAAADPEFRKNMLFQGDDGWFSATVVDFQGPAALLKALYPLATSTK